MSEPKNVLYDFEMTSFVGIEAPVGTDPETLVAKALATFAERCLSQEAQVELSQIYDPETGEYTKPKVVSGVEGDGGGGGQPAEAG